jgi:hypothetical protein
VPTTTHPVVNPTSGPPVSGAPTSGGPVSATAPVSPGFTPAGYGQPPAYVPALPDPSTGPVSGVPGPRGAASLPAQPEVAPAQHPEKTAQHPGEAARHPGEAARHPEGIALHPEKTARHPEEAARHPEEAALHPEEAALHPEETAQRATTEQVAEAAPATVVRTVDDAAPRRPWDEDSGPRTPAPRRSASLEDAEPARRGRRAAPDDDDDEPEAQYPREDQPLRPGDVAEGHIAFWDDDATRHFRAAWHEVKAEFVDDPVRALTRAHDLLTDAVNELTEALLAERDELDPLRGTATPDTESMRMAMRGYREFLDRILSL